MSALVEEIRAAVQQALREELPRALAELRGSSASAPATELLGVAAAARRLGLRTGTVYKMAARGELPSHKIGGRRLFAPADLDAFAEARRCSPERVRELAKGGA
jgi:excisionase family DNA binding protein